MGIRSQIRNRNRFVSEPHGTGSRRFVLVCLGSLGVHLVFFLSLVFFHDFDFLAPKPRVVRVDLVSFTPGPVGGPKAPAAVEPVPAKAASADVSVASKPAESVKAPVEQPPEVPTITPDLSLKTKPKNIKELMEARKKEEEPPKAEPPKEKEAKKEAPPKPKPDPEKELQKARDAMAKKVEAQGQDQIAEALKRMQAAVAEQGENPQGDAIGQGMGTGPGKKGTGPLELYKLVIASTIRQNWVFSDAMARMDKNLECRVLIKILKSGEIRDIIYETRSGNQYLDESAKRAIRRSSPLPELPLGLKSYDIGLVFSPEGLK